MKVPVTFLAPEKKVPRVRTSWRTVIKPGTAQKVPVQVNNHDPVLGHAVVFVPQYNNATKDLERDGGIYTHTADAGLTNMMMKNDSDKDLIVPRHTFVSFVECLHPQDVFCIEGDAHDLAVAWQYHQETQKADDRLQVGPGEVDEDHIYRTPNGITVYAESEDERAQLFNLLDEFHDVFEDQGALVKVPHGEEMRIPMKSGWDEKR